MLIGALVIGLFNYVFQAITQINGSHFDVLYQNDRCGLGFYDYSSLDVGCGEYITVSLFDNITFYVRN